MIIEYSTEQEPATLIPFSTFMEDHSLTLQVITMLSGVFCCQIKDIHITQADASAITMGAGATKGEALHRLATAIYNKMLSGPPLAEAKVSANIIVENPTYYEETVFV